MKLKISNRRKLENSQMSENKQHIPDQPMSQEDIDRKRRDILKQNKMETQHIKTYGMIHKQL